MCAAFDLGQPRRANTERHFTQPNSRRGQYGISKRQADRYNDTVVRQFAIMTVVWGVVGMLVGVIIAAQLAWPELNFGIPWLSYGRLRPLHTNAVIFAFGGCGLFASCLLRGAANLPCAHL